MKGTVLLVDDEKDTREMLARALVRAGYDCVAAAGGEEALASAARGRSFDAVVTDVVMGGDDRRGLSLMRELRTLGVRAPVVVITAYADVEKVKIALNQGAAHLIEKPFRAAELIEVIDRVCRSGGDLRDAVDAVLSRANLTDKERVVARHLLEGRTSAEIAELEQNSPRTIRQHVTTIYSKCGARNRAEFVRAVFENAGRRSW
jgi:DNA-binding NarL/FixJ family response regulator